MESSEMKRDKAWFKNEIEIMGSETSENYPHEQMVDREEVYDLIDQLDEPEKVVIPQPVADWWEGDSVTMYGGESINKKYKLRLISEFHDRGLGDHLSKVEDWIDENDSVFLDLVNGKPYEVEKEKLYYIKFSENQYAQKFDGTKIDSMLINDKSIAGKFTKDDIEKMNPKLMPFAVEVAE